MPSLRYIRATTSAKWSSGVTSPEGKFFALLPNGYYYLTVEIKNPDGSYTLVHTSKDFKVKRGFVNEKIYI